MELKETHPVLLSEGNPTSNLKLPPPTPLEVHDTYQTQYHAIHLHELVEAISSKLKRHFLIHTRARDYVCPHEGYGKLLHHRLVATTHSSMCQNASLGQLYGDMQEVYQQIQTPLINQQQSAQELEESTIQLTSSMGNIGAPADDSVFDIEKEIDDVNL